MAIGKKVTLDISRKEWEAYPKDKREAITELLYENYNCNVDDLINDEGEK